MKYAIEDIAAYKKKLITAEYEESDKQKLLAYMKRFEPCLVTSTPLVDRFTKQKVGEANNGFSDGVYTWYASEIYELECYNLKLDDGFIRHVLKQMRS